MRKIIIRVPNFIGDTVNCTPALELLKQEYPNAEFTIIGPRFVEDLFKHDPRITHIISFDRKKKKLITLLKRIRKQEYDLGFIFINTLVSALFFKLCRIKKIIGYDNEKRGFLLDFTLPLDRNTHYINRYATLINCFLQKKYTYLPALKLYYTKEKTFHFNNERQTIGLYLGSESKGFRCYPKELSIKLLQLLAAEYNLVMIGDNNDNISHCSYLQAIHSENVVNLTGKTTIEGFVNTIANLDILITIDSSAMHIAAATQTPFIALMGLSTSPTSTITPKVSFGQILKIENNMIQEEDYIKNITPETIIHTLKKML